MTKLIALIGLVLCSLNANAAVIEMQGPNLMVIHGDIMVDDLKQFEAALIKWAGDNGFTEHPVPGNELYLVVDIDSNGGAAIEGLKIHLLLKALADRPDVHVACMVSDKCTAASAAAIIFNSGDEQVLGRGAAVMYHLPFRPSSPGPDAVIDDLDRAYLKAMRCNVLWDVADLCEQASIREGAHVFYGVHYVDDNSETLMGIRVDSNAGAVSAVSLPINPSRK